MLLWLLLMSWLLLLLCLVNSCCPVAADVSAALASCVL